VLAHVHARDEVRAARAEAEVLAAYTIGGEAVAARPVLLEVIE
jgi:thymidine phosphorylase